MALRQSAEGGEMAMTPQEVAQVIALKVLEDPKVANMLRDEWASDRKVAAIGKKAGVLYRSIYKEVLDAYRSSEPWQLLRDVTSMAAVAPSSGDGYQTVSGDGHNNLATNNPGTGRKTR